MLNIRQVNLFLMNFVLFFTRFVPVRRSVDTDKNFYKKDLANKLQLKSGIIVIT